VSEGDIRAAHPNVSFPTPFVPPEEYAYVFPAPVAFEPGKQVAVEARPELTEKGHWEQRWSVRDLTEEEATQLAAIATQQQNAATLAKIKALEAQQTERLVREAVLGGEYALEKLAQIEAEIQALGVRSE